MTKEALAQNQKICVVRRRSPEARGSWIYILIQNMWKGDTLIWMVRYV